MWSQYLSRTIILRNRKIQEVSQHKKYNESILTILKEHYCGIGVASKKVTTKRGPKITPGKRITELAKSKKTPATVETPASNPIDEDVSDQLATWNKQKVGKE